VDCSARAPDRQPQSTQRRGSSPADRGKAEAGPNTADRWRHLIAFLHMDARQRRAPDGERRGGPGFPISV
jgi:hypothetical protein